MRAQRPSSFIPSLLVTAVCCGCNGSAPGDGNPVDAGSPDLMEPVHHRAPPRAEMAYGYDAVSNKIIAFGGDDGAEVAQTLLPHFHDDTWIYDVKTGDWTVSAAKGPMARGRAAFAMDTKNHRLLMTLGRYRSATAKGTTPFTLLSDTWAYDPAADAWTQLMPTGTPAGRSAVTTVYDAAKDRLVMFGGNTSPSFDVIFGPMPTAETWQLVGGATWSKVKTSGTAPSARHLATSALDEKRQRLIVVGGIDNMGGFLSDVWALDLATDTWSMLRDGGDALSDRLGASAAYDAVGDSVVVFGGHDMGSLGHVNDTLGFSLAASGWKVIGPGDQPGNVVLGCAGNSTEQPYDFTLVDKTSPERRERAMLTSAGDRLVLYGGEGDCAQLDDTWTLAAGAWTRRIPANQGESCMRKSEQCACLCQ